MTAANLAVDARHLNPARAQAEEFLAENHAIMMYEPLLQAPRETP